MVNVYIDLSNQTHQRYMRFRTMGRSNIVDRMIFLMSNWIGNCMIIYQTLVQITDRGDDNGRISRP